MPRIVGERSVSCPPRLLLPEKPDPVSLFLDELPNMRALCDQIGATHYFRVTGDSNGLLWGTDVYTGDSAIAAAAVHACLDQPGESAVVKISVERPLSHSRGSLRNGMASRDFGHYETAHRVAGV